jgi:hypothetical protein
MNNSKNRSVENWQRRMAAVVNPGILDSEQLQSLIVTSKSVIELGQLPAIDGHPASEVDYNIRLETQRFTMKLTYTVPDPIDSGVGVGKGKGVKR